jgi:hypothetical protein
MMMSRVLATVSSLGWQMREMSCGSAASHTCSGMLLAKAVMMLTTVTAIERS